MSETALCPKHMAQLSTDKIQMYTWHYIWDRHDCSSGWKFISVDSQPFSGLHSQFADGIYFHNIFRDTFTKHRRLKFKVFLAPRGNAVQGWRISFKQIYDIKKLWQYFMYFIKLYHIYDLINILLVGPICYILLLFYKFEVIIYILLLFAVTLQELEIMAPCNLL